jgi:hypothetical protein
MVPFYYQTRKALGIIWAYVSTKRTYHTFWADLSWSKMYSYNLVIFARESHFPCFCFPALLFRPFWMTLLLTLFIRWCRGCSKFRFLKAFVFRRNLRIKCFGNNHKKMESCSNFFFFSFFLGYSTLGNVCALLEICNHSEKLFFLLSSVQLLEARQNLLGEIFLVSRTTCGTNQKTARCRRLLRKTLSDDDALGESLGLETSAIEGMRLAQGTQWLDEGNRRVALRCGVF